MVTKNWEFYQKIRHNFGCIQDRVAIFGSMVWYNFRCQGNKGMSEPNVTGIVELADPENHTIEPKLRLYLIY